MAKEIDLTGIAAGVQQANRGRRQYAEDILKDERDEQFKSLFVKPFVEETFFDGPERRRKEQLELQMRSPELINQINNSKAKHSTELAERLKSTFDSLNEDPEGLDRAAEKLARNKINATPLGQQFLNSGVLNPNSPQFSFVPDILRQDIINSYEERVQKQKDHILSVHEDVTKTGVFKNYDLTTAYSLAQDVFDKASAGISLGVESSDIFRQGINALFGDDDAYEIAKLRQGSINSQSKLDNFQNTMENYTKEMNKTIEVSDDIKTNLDSIAAIDKEDYEKFIEETRETMNTLSSDKPDEAAREIFTSAPNVLSQWSIDDSGDISTLTKVKESTVHQNPFGYKTEWFDGRLDTSKISDDKVVIKERVINDDGKLVEQVVAEGTGTKDYASVLTNMVSQLAIGLKYEDERRGRGKAKLDRDYLISAYTILAKTGYIRMNNSNDIEAGITIVKPFSPRSRPIFESIRLSKAERKNLGIDALYNMGVNKSIQEAEKTGGGNAEKFVETAIEKAEEDIVTKLEDTIDVDNREALNSRLDTIEESKTNPNEARREILRTLIAPTDSQKGQVLNEAAFDNIPYTAGDITQKEAMTIYNVIIEANEVDEDPELLGLINAVFTNNNNSLDNQMLRISDVDRQSVPFSEIGSNISKLNERMQRSSDLNLLRKYAELGDKAFINPNKLKRLYDKYDLKADASQEDVQEFLRTRNI